MRKLILVLIFITSFAAAQSESVSSNNSFVEKVYQGQSKSESSVGAKKEIMEDAIEAVSNELILSSIGKEKFSRNKSIINQKIIKQSGKYIPVLKAGNVQRDGDGFKLSVYMQVNPKILETLLLQNGLLYQAEGAPIILPLIRIVDRSGGRSYAWWIRESDSSLQVYDKVLENLLQRAFFDSEFYGVRPTSSQLGQLIPDFFRKDRFTADDLQVLAVQFNSQLLLTGEMSFTSASGARGAEVELKISGYQGSNGKLLAELVRRFSIDRASLEGANRKMVAQLDNLIRDLAGQVLEAWKRGTFGATTARLIVQGGVPINKIDNLKALVQQSSKSIRQIRERVISQDSIVFEIEVVAPLESISKDISAINVGEKSWVLSNVGSESISYTLRRR